MAWITPKTDWDAEYRWDKDDINRIQDNMIWLKDFIADYASKLYPTPVLVPFNTGKTFASMFYASEMNNIENNLATINNTTLRNNIGQTKTYRANGSTPDYSEFNRIESATLLLREGIQSNIDALPKLSFTLGNMRGIKI